MLRRLLLLILISFVLIKPISLSNIRNKHPKTEGPTRYQIATWDWEEVSVPYAIALWILVASVAKILFHIWPQVSEMFPDSSLLIMVGLAIGICLSLLKVNRDKFQLESHVFFLYILPPLVFDAGYHMPARYFFDNLGSILAFAIIGTIWNCLAIGFSLWAIGRTGLFDQEMPLFHYLLFGALLSNVDPVAVMVIFEEMKINDNLSIAVFGESLLNDGVSVVLYRMMLTFTKIGTANVIPIDYIAGLISFVVIAFGGIFCGLLWAFLACFITKYTGTLEVLNPIFLLVCPYCAYLTCEMFGLSSILGIVFCGIALKPYVKENVSESVSVSMSFFVKVMALGSETVIFVFLGLSTVSSEHHWNSMFIILTVVMCIIYRVLGVTFLCYFLNKRRLRKYSKADQFIISYGGLRGAIAYGLVAALPDELPEKRLFVTACIVVIYWTVFFQGLTLRPIANFLKLERKEEHMKNMSEYTYQNLIDYTMSGMEEIAGIKGHHYVRHAYESFNKRFLKSILVKSRARKQMDNTNLVRAYRRIRRREAEDRLKKFDEPVDTLAQALMLHRGQYWSPAAQMAYYKHQAIPKGIQTQNDLQRSTEGDDVLSSESATELDDIGINESNVGHEEPQQIPVPKLSRTSQNSEL